MKPALAAALIVLLAGCRSSADRIHDPAQDLETEYVAGPDGKEHQLLGDASYYADRFHGRKTASGELYDKHAFTAAHRTLPFHSVVRVTHRDTRKSVVVRVTDRGPFGSKKRVIDLSWAAAHDIGMLERGIVPVALEVLQWGDGTYVTSRAKR